MVTLGGWGCMWGSLRDCCKGTSLWELSTPTKVLFVVCFVGFFDCCVVFAGLLGCGHCSLLSLRSPCLHLLLSLLPPFSLLCSLPFSSDFVCSLFLFVSFALPLCYYFLFSLFFPFSRS
eukprot:Lithocolla_globosa_v1_NODE_1949_length_2245_cov_3.221005.p3 type:complete len:119 gc:universal NODE_1949_length_2245_cov_3.221005:1754-1398(-)